MNRELQGNEYQIPKNVIDHLNLTITQYPNDNDGIMRAQNLINTGKINYGQLKRILHDMKYIDKENDSIKYNLWGGEPMETWASSLLTGERNLVQNNKDISMKANEVGGIDGMVQNPHNKTHEKKKESRSLLNPMKSNSDKTSVSSISLAGGIFEEIERIKQLMT